MSVFLDTHAQSYAKKNTCTCFKQSVTGKHVQDQLGKLYRSSFFVVKQPLLQRSLVWGSLGLTLNHCNKPIQRQALTNCKLSFIWHVSILFSLTAHKAAVTTSVTLCHMLNHQCAGVSSTVVAVIVQITAILQPLKCEVISCGFNLEGCLCSSEYRLAFGVLDHPRGVNWHRRGKIYFGDDLQSH